MSTDVSANNATTESANNNVYNDTTLANNSATESANNNTSNNTTLANNSATESANNNTTLANQVYASSISSGQTNKAPTGLKAAIDAMLNYADALQALEGAVAQMANDLYETLSEFSEEENADMITQTQTLDNLPAGDTGNSTTDADNNKAITDQQALIQQHQTVYQNQISIVQAEAQLVQSSTSSIASSLASLFNNAQSLTSIIANAARNM